MNSVIFGVNNHDSYNICSYRLKKRFVHVVATTTIIGGVMISQVYREELKAYAVKCLNEYTAKAEGTNLVLPGIFYLCSYGMVNCLGRASSRELINTVGGFIIKLALWVSLATIGLKLLNPDINDRLLTYVDIICSVTLILALSTGLFALAYLHAYPN